jgi:hypothetical protein
MALAYDTTPEGVVSLLGNGLQGEIQRRIKAKISAMADTIADEIAAELAKGIRSSIRSASDHRSVLGGLQITVMIDGLERGIKAAAEPGKPA